MAALAAKLHLALVDDHLAQEGAPDCGSVAGSLVDETSQCLCNLTAVCEAAGTPLGQALRLTVYTTDLGAFAEINDAYAAFFADDPPARVAVGVAALPKDARAEIHAVVAVS